MTVANRFDYSVVATTDRAMIEDAAQRIHQLERRTSEALIEIGRHLIAVKEAMGHGKFGEWIEAEFGWSERTARNLMRVSEVFGDQIGKICRIQTSALYALASGEVPEEIREEFLEQAERGESVTNKQVQSRLQSIKAQPSIIPPTVEPIDAEPLDARWTCLECGQEWPESRKYCDCHKHPAIESMSGQGPGAFPATVAGKALPADAAPTRDQLRQQEAAEQATSKRLFEIVGDPKGEIERAERIRQFDQRWEHVTAIINFDPDAVADVIPMSNALRWQIHDLRAWLDRLEKSYGRGLRLVSGGNG